MIPRPDFRIAWRALRHNWLLKFFSLGFALGLWAFVNFGERDAEKTLVVPLELRSLTPTLMVTSPVPDSVDVRLKGPSTLLGTIDGRDAALRLDLSNVRTGETTFRVEPDMLTLPRGIRVIRVSPSQVTLSVETVRQKELPVVVDFGEAVPRGFKVARTDVQPPFVRVSGPASQVEEWESVKTQPVYLMPSSGTFEKIVPLRHPGEFTRLTPDRVNVRVRLEEIVGTQEFKNVKIGVKHAAGPYRLRRRHADVTVTGPERLLRDLQGNSIDAYVDVTGLEPGRHELAIQVALPDGLRAVEIRPGEVPLELLPEPPGPARSEGTGT